jgi:hypothetical protein
MIFSRRKRLASGVTPNLYHDTLSPKLRVQLLQLTDEAIDLIDASHYYSGSFHHSIVLLLRKKIGVHSLSRGLNSTEEFRNWFANEERIEYVIDAIEVIATFTTGIPDHYYSYGRILSLVDELNSRMLEDGFGYQFGHGQIIQLSSEYMHQEAATPVLSLLRDPAFAAADQEFRQAHAEFRQGEYEDCIHDCCNTFESTLKVILSKKKWKFNDNDSAKALLEIAFSNGLIPLHFQSQFGGLRSILESGIPTVRNKNAGHGAGTTPRTIPKYLAAFQLQQTAATILMLIEASK